MDTHGRYCLGQVHSFLMIIAERLRRGRRGSRNFDKELRPFRSDPAKGFPRYVIPSNTDMAVLGLVS